MLVLSGFVERGVGVVGDAFDLAVYGGFGASFLFFVVGEAGVVFVVVARGYFMKRGFFEMNLKMGSWPLSKWSTLGSPI